MKLHKQAYLVDPIDPFDLRGSLSRDVEIYYGRVADIRQADLGDLWELARDLVLSLDQWGKVAQQRPGSERMAIALDVAWGFVTRRGGLEAVRERIAQVLPLPGWIEKKLLGFLLSESRAKKIVRFVLELAVRELRKFRS